MTSIAFAKPGTRGPLRRTNPLLIYAAVAMGSILLLGGVAVAAVI